MRNFKLECMFLNLKNKGIIPNEYSLDDMDNVVIERQVWINLGSVKDGEVIVNDSDIKLLLEFYDWKEVVENNEED